jgi:DNA-binding HxlR family transcriptional regulator
MATTFEGVLADRSTWQVQKCSIEMALDVIGTRSSMLILREAIYGTTRFDGFARRTKLTDAIVASRLKRLTDIGLFVRQPYREPGKRTRDEYLLTDKGTDLVPAVFALMQWGDTHLQAEEGGPLRLVERGTQEPVVIGPRTVSGKILTVEDLAIVANEHWAAPQNG